MTDKNLIVKLTSMGDLVQCLPAVTDALRAHPGIEFDWVVDKAFAAVPNWHPAVKRVVCSNHRSWRKQIRHHWQNKEIQEFFKSLRSKRYDRVIDAQSNLKSSLVTRMARGRRIGLDAASVREWGSHLVYNQKFAIDPKLHHVQRMRMLFANVFDYAHPHSDADYGIDRSIFGAPPEGLPERYVMFMHSASREYKLWPVAHWQQLILDVSAHDRKMHILLPYYDKAEQQRAEFLASSHENVHVLPRLGLNELAGVIQGAVAFVACDTGLAHVAAALRVPGVTIYGRTDPLLCGTYGERQQHLRAADKDSMGAVKPRDVLESLLTEI